MSVKRFLHPTLVFFIWTFSLGIGECLAQDPPTYWWQCTFCCETRSDYVHAPGGKGCRTNDSHRWVKLGKEGERIYKCKFCGVSEGFEGQPLLSVCCKAEKHLWSFEKLKSEIPHMCSRCGLRAYKKIGDAQPSKKVEGCIDAQHTWQEEEYPYLVNGDLLSVPDALCVTFKCDYAAFCSTCEQWYPYNQKEELTNKKGCLPGQKHTYFKFHTGPRLSKIEQEKRQKEEYRLYLEQQAQEAKKDSLRKEEAEKDIVTVRCLRCGDYSRVVDINREFTVSSSDGNCRGKGLYHNFFVTPKDYVKWQRVNHLYNPFGRYTFFCRYEGCGVFGSVNSPSQVKELAHRICSHSPTQKHDINWTHQGYEDLKDSGYDFFAAAELLGRFTFQCKDCKSRYSVSDPAIFRKDACPNGGSEHTLEWTDNSKARLKALKKEAR